MNISDMTLNELYEARDKTDTASELGKDIEEAIYSVLNMEYHEK